MPRIDPTTNQWVALAIAGRVICDMGHWTKEDKAALKSAHRRGLIDHWRSPWLECMGAVRDYYGPANTCAKQKES